MLDFVPVVLSGVLSGEVVKIARTQYTCFQKHCVNCFGSACFFYYYRFFKKGLIIKGFIIRICTDTSNYYSTSNNFKNRTDRLYTFLYSANFLVWEFEQIAVAAVCRWTDVG